MWSPCWSFLVSKIPQFLAESYQLRQLITLFQKVDTLRLLKIYIMFCLPTGAKNTHFCRVQLMDYTFHSQDQTFLIHCSFSDSNYQKHQVRQNGNRKPVSFRAFKNKSISIKEVNYQQIDIGIF